MNETQQLLAKQASAYYTDLADRGVPSELAAQLVRDWHVAQLQNRCGLMLTPPITPVNVTVLLDMLRGQLQTIPGGGG